MKNTMLLCVSLMLRSMCYSQEKSFPRNADGEYEFSEVVETGMSKQAMYGNALSWAMETYENYKSVVYVESEIDGRLVIKANDLVLYNMNNWPKRKVERVFYTLTIECKDNKYRYVFTDIKIKDFSPSKYSMYWGDEIGWDVTHEGHMERIIELNALKDSIEAQMRNENSTLKGRKLKKSVKKYTRRLEEINKDLMKEEYLYNEEYDGLSILINGLKKRMSVKSDF